MSGGMMAASLVSTVVQTLAQHDAAKRQRQALDRATDKMMEMSIKELEQQKYMWDQTRADFQPYMQMGYEGVAQLRDIMPQVLNTTLQPYSQAFRQFQLTQTQIDPYTGLVQTPELQTQGYQGFDPNDPVFQNKLDIVNQQTDAWLAKQGLLNSTAGKTIKDRAVQGLVNEEVDKQYQRDINERAAQNQIAQQQYLLSSGAGEQLYGRMTDERARAMEEDARRMALLQQQYGVDESLFGKRYGMVTDWTKIGQGAAGQAGQLSQAPGMGIASTYGNMGANLASGAMAQGALAGQQSQMMGNTFGGLMNALSQMNQGQPQQPQQPQYMAPYGQYGGGGSGYNENYGSSTPPPGARPNYYQ